MTNNTTQSGSLKIPKLRFAGFEGEWEEKKLGELGEIYQPKTISQVELIDEGYDVYGANGIIGKYSHFNHENEQIAIACRGNTCGTVNFTKPKSWITGNAMVINLDRSKDARKDFMYYLLQNTNFRYLISGSGQPQITGNIKKHKVQRPSLPEQQKIADFLGSVDEYIRMLKKQKDGLEKYKKGMMQKIFSREIRFSGFSGEWEERKLGEVGEIYDGTHQTPKYVKEGVPFYSVEHLTANNFSNTKYISEEVFEKENKRVKLEKGDILMTRIGNIGTARLIDWNVRASFYVSLALIKTNEEVDSQFLAQYISYADFQRELWKRTIHVAFPQKINLGEITHCLINLPSLPEQQKIAEFLSSIDDMIEAKSVEIEKAEEWKRGVMQGVFV
jgi:type I restriction enzyme S subunit